MSKLLTIHEAASLMGVSAQTIRRWEREGKPIPSVRTKGGQRRYDPHDLPIIRRFSKKKLTVAYARVSSHDQKEDLIRQEKMLEMFCSSNGWTFTLISDLGSGMNYHKKGLRKLLQLILNREIDRLVLTHKDRLLRSSHIHNQAQHLCEILVEAFNATMSPRGRAMSPQGILQASLEKRGGRC